MSGSVHSENTLKAYRYAILHFMGPEQRCLDLASEPGTVAAYMTTRMKGRASSVSVFLAAIRHYHRDGGSAGNSPDHRHRSERKQPATAERLAAMLAHMPHDVMAKRVRASILLGMVGALPLCGAPSW